MKFNIAKKKNLENNVRTGKFLSRERSLEEIGLINEEPNDSHERWKSSGREREKQHELIFTWSFEVDMLAINKYKWLY